MCKAVVFRDKWMKMPSASCFLKKEQLGVYLPSGRFVSVLVCLRGWGREEGSANTLGLSMRLLHTYVQATKVHESPPPLHRRAAQFSLNRVLLLNGNLSTRWTDDHSGWTFTFVRTRIAVAVCECLSWIETFMTLVSVNRVWRKLNCPFPFWTSYLGWTTKVPFFARRTNQTVPSIMPKEMLTVEMTRRSGEPWGLRIGGGQDRGRVLVLENVSISTRRMSWTG